MSSVVGDWIKIVLDGGSMQMTGCFNVFRCLGDELAQYLDEQKSFKDMEMALAAAIRVRPDDRSLFQRLYHVLNHVESDKGNVLSVAVSKPKLRSISTSLIDGLRSNVDQAIEAFWS